jgi:hypothetical protein
MKCSNHLHPDRPKHRTSPFHMPKCKRKGCKQRVDVATEPLCDGCLQEMWAVIEAGGRYLPGK